MKIIIFDTETTGFPNASTDLSTQPYACQFAAITLEYDTRARTIQEISRVDQLLRPAISIPPEVSAIHGITDRTVAAAPSFGQFADAMLGLFAAADVAVAHNLEFDEKIISIELQRLGRSRSFLPSQSFCTMKTTVDLCQIPNRRGDGYSYPRLEVLYEKLFGRKFHGAHNALADVKATARIACELLQRGVFAPSEPSQNTLF